MRATVSFVIPAGPGSKWLGEALESIEAQSFPGLETVVVVNGASEGGDFDLASRKWLKVVRTREPIGAAKARNLGIARAEGEFVATLDADDLAAPSRVETTLGLFEDNPEVAVVGGAATLIDEAGAPIGVRRVGSLNPHEAAEELTRRNAFVHSSTMFRRSAMLDVGMYSASAGRFDDYEFILRLAIAGHSCLRTDDVLCAYRLHPQQASRGPVPLGIVLRIVALRRQLARRMGVSATVGEYYNVAWLAAQAAHALKVRSPVERQLRR